MLKMSNDLLLNALLMKDSQICTSYGFYLDVYENVISRVKRVMTSEVNKLSAYVMQPKFKPQMLNQTTFGRNEVVVASVLNSMLFCFFEMAETTSILHFYCEFKFRRRNEGPTSAYIQALYTFTAKHQNLKTLRGTISHPFVACLTNEHKLLYNFSCCLCH